METPFRTQARTLKSPTSIDFNFDDWKRAYDVAPGKTEDDRRLLTTAGWFAIQSAALREWSSNSVLHRLDDATSTLLAIATINREFLTARSISNQAQTKRKDALVALDHLVDQQILTCLSGQTASVGDVVETIVDGAESWLFDIAKNSASDEEPPADLLKIGIEANAKYNVQHTLNHLWNQAIWEGWQLTNEAGKLVFAPIDRKAATLIEATRARQAANFMDYPWIDMRAWSMLRPEGRQQRLSLQRSVTEVSISGGHRRIRVRRPSCRSNRPTIFLIERAGLEGSYLAPFLDMPLPNYSPLTCRMILQTWHVILDLAEALAKHRSAQEGLAIEDLGREALVVYHKELVDVLTRAISDDGTIVKLLIDFLSFKPRLKGGKGHRGLWSAPLIPIPGGDTFALPLPALSASNPLRKAEAWLERGGLDDSSGEKGRGDIYEANVRNEAFEAISKNALLPTSICARVGIKKNKDFDQQIDLIVRLGDDLIVGEVKCFLFVADPHERFNYFRKLKGASVQAKAKAAALGARPDLISRVLGISEDEARSLQILPLVVVNQGFGFSLNVDGCRVVESAFLLHYFRTGSIITQAVIDKRTGAQQSYSTTFYRSEQEAAAVLEKTLAAPPVLTRFIDRISWINNAFPSFTGEFSVAVPMLGNFGTEELSRGAALAAALE